MSDGRRRRRYAHHVVRLESRRRRQFVDGRVEQSGTLKGQVWIAGDHAAYRLMTLRRLVQVTLDQTDRRVALVHDDRVRRRLDGHRPRHRRRVGLPHGQVADDVALLGGHVAAGELGLAAGCLRNHHRRRALDVLRCGGCQRLVARQSLQRRYFHLLHLRRL